MQKEAAGLVGSRWDLLRGNQVVDHGAEINRPPCDQVDRKFCERHCCCWHGTWCTCECFHAAGTDGVHRCAWTYDDIRKRAMQDEMEARG
ncbi:hypothetical protein DPF_0823 [Desulfoplanes formicivorans]|uniref:Uncharacterized protein n=1 Tax=Desulfoplanes formicivorans TaxID=1592317 RepID=A0A194AFY6_9BACT|nr:hypothetical protein DPF_0823 [Desulfoplanes formicivorans]